MIQNNLSRAFISLGSVNAFLAVAFGAFGAHMIRNKLPEGLYTVYQTGVSYQFYHALGLIGVGLLLMHLRHTLIKMAGWFMLAGIIIFSGSLYVLSLSGVRGWGAVTPIGGLSFLAAWLLLAIGAWRADKPTS